MSRPRPLALLTALLLVAPVGARAQRSAPPDASRGGALRDALAAGLPWQPVGTFSILGYDPETGEVGGAVQSRVFSVGNGVLWGEADVGVVATQAVVDVSYGPQALALLRAGLAPRAVVDSVWKRDPDPRPADWTKQGRQFAVMDARGRVAAFTGPEAPTWAGDRQGAFCSAQGNILAGRQVVDSMVAAFERSRGAHLSLRLVAALEAGQRAGGDTRGMQSAAILVVKKGGGVWLNNDVVLRLQVDDAPEPIAELRRLVDKAAQQRAAVRARQAGAPRERATPAQRSPAQPTPARRP
jgi:uncharacterized Ntn-hydrolase superfamily protein